MSVLIKGMEIPESCAKCPFQTTYEGFNCNLFNGSVDWLIDNRPDWCPLEEVDDV